MTSSTFPARRRTRLAAGAAAGAAVALSLLTAEVATSLLLGVPLPPRAWAFLALYCVPAFTIAGAVGAVALPLERLSAAAVWLTAALYCTAVASQDLLGGRARLTPMRVAALLSAAAAMAAAAWVTERVLARRAVAPSYERHLEPRHR